MSEIEEIIIATSLYLVVSVTSGYILREGINFTKDKLGKLENYLIMRKNLKEESVYTSKSLY